MPASICRPRALDALAILASLLLVSACGEEPRVREATLGNLVTGSEHFMDREVSTQGVVRTFPQPLHYWLEDDNRNRVGLTPETLVEDLVGTRVRVTGTFRFTQDRGRLIAVESVEVLSAP